MYSLAIHLYAFVVALLAPFHKKARLLRLGQWRTNSILREKIDRNAKYIWIHASSLGEFEQGRPLMERIRAERPEYKILLTFFSPSGYEVRKNYDGADVICYLPFDTPFRVKKFLRLANPAMAVFIKYEFWGNYLRELHKRHIPVYIISAIFRREQLFFQWFGAPYRKMLTYFTHLFVQDERSRELLAEYGVTNVTVAGDTRFDRVLEVRRQARELPLIERFLERGDGKRPVVLVAGSSWPQDEALFIPYFHARPERSWAQIREVFYDNWGGALPNGAHKALAALEREGFLHTVVTQNIDCLHQRAGSKHVLEFHGTLDKLLCTECGRRFGTTRKLICLSAPAAPVVAPAAAPAAHPGVPPGPAEHQQPQGHDDHQDHQRKRLSNQGSCYTRKRRPTNSMDRKHC